MTLHLRSLSFFFLCTLFLVGCQNKRSENTSPNLLALVVGVLEFADPKIESFPLAGRKDEELVATLSKLTTRKENIVFVKEKEVTVTNIEKSLDRVLANSKPNDRFLFYYAGHGTVESDKVFLVPHDMDSERPEETGYDALRLIQTISEKFKGSEVILVGDFCNSGVLGEVAEAIGKRNPKIKATAVTSAHRLAYSTGNWTYTELLISLFEGNPELDLNGDGLITTKEVRENTFQVMWRREDQLSGEGHSSPAEENLVWAKTSNHKGVPELFYKRLPDRPMATHKPGTFLQANRDGEWVNVEVVETFLGFYKVRYPKEIQAWDEWLGVKYVRELPTLAHF